MYAYAALLAEEVEWEKLLSVVQTNPLFIEHYGNQLAHHFPTESYLIYEDYIMNEAAVATDRRKYKGVCRLIKAYLEAGAKIEARNMIGPN
jgi:GH35 family endo-1,4-beta-xylanase